MTTGAEAADIAPALHRSVIEESDELFMSRVSDAVGAQTLPAADAFLPLTDHADAAIRRRAVYVLSHIGGSEAVRAICGRLDDDSELVRSSAVSSLGRLQAGEAVPPLIDLFTSRAEDSPLLKAAAEALGKIGDLSALGTLQEASRSAKGVTVRSACMMAASKLQAIARRQGQPS